MVTALRCVVLASAVLGLSACALNGPTGSSFTLKTVNDTASPATVRWCDSRACGNPGWVDRIAAGSTTSNVVNNMTGAPLVFSVSVDGRPVRCIRLNFGRRDVSGATIHLSNATAGACRGRYLPRKS